MEKGERVEMIGKKGEGKKKLVNIVKGNIEDK